MNELPALVAAGSSGDAGFVLALLALLLWGWPRLAALARPHQTAASLDELKKEVDELKKDVARLAGEESKTVAQIKALLLERLEKPRNGEARARSRSQEKRED